jgi:hypothetical protein
MKILAAVFLAMFTEIAAEAGTPKQPEVIFSAPLLFALTWVAHTSSAGREMVFNATSTTELGAS